LTAFWLVIGTYVAGVLITIYSLYKWNVRQARRGNPDGIIDSEAIGMAFAWPVAIVFSPLIVGAWLGERWDQFSRDARDVAVSRKRRLDEAMRMIEEDDLAEKEEHPVEDDGGRRRVAHQRVREPGGTHDMLRLRAHSRRRHRAQA